MNINSFSGEHRFLSNFWPCTVLLEGEEYFSVENAYVAAKTTDKNIRKVIKGLTPGKAKRYGRDLRLRDDWDDIKLDVMECLVRQKFSRVNSSLGIREKLVAITGEIVEENNWGDTFWGVCDNIGSNHLGKILMKIREEIK